MRATARTGARTSSGTAGQRHEHEADRAAHEASSWVTGSGAGKTSTVVHRLGRWLGHDLSRIRIHAGPEAARSADAVGARAYTVGDDVVIGGGGPAPHTEAGRRLLAHELAHVVQQRGGAPAAGLRRTALTAAPAGVLQGQFVTPHAAGGGWHGVLERDRRRASRRRPMHFYHGTSWEVARNIPGQVRPAGGGDFAAGFYTHHDRSDARAKHRAKVWGMRIARGMGEPYAGVLDFTVQAGDFAALLGPGRSLDFGLTSRDQPGYAARQRHWIRFVTGHGRERRPTYDPAVPGWRHERRDPQPHLPYQVIRGPFYRGIPGLPGPAPGPAEFHPYAEGRELPQQVVFANEGIDLLNSSRVRTDLEQYDARTGDRSDPPQATPPGPAARTPANIPPLVPPTEPLEL